MTTPLIPRSVLFGEPGYANPAISPDGRMLAHLEPLSGALNAFVRPLVSDPSTARPVTHESAPGLRWYRWTQDGRHLVWLQDGHGDEDWHLWCADIDGRRQRDLTPVDGVQARLLAAPDQDPSRLLVAINDRDPHFHDVYEVEVATGERRMRCRNPGFAEWIVDSAGELRAALRATDDGGVELCTWEHHPDRGRVVFACGPDDAAGTRVVGIEANGSGAYLLSAVGEETVRLLRLDLRTGARAEVFADPRYDVEQVVCQPTTGRPQLAAVNGDRLTWHPVDPAARAALRRLHRPDADVRVVATDRADRRWILNIAPATASLSYELFDRAADRIEPLGRYHPRLDDYPLASTLPFRFAARDGLEISGYLTFPPGLRQHRLPTVLAVHGGPWSRDTWGFEPQIQWLANRGYLAVQVNYRGSTGFGRSFAAAGHRQWGAAMQTDLFDAIAYLVARGYADPCRLGILGSSYGGYAALMGVALAPELLRCAVAMAAPVDLRALLASVPRYWRPLQAMLYRRVGDPRVDEAMLWSRSPLAHVDRIRAAVLLANGDNDPRVSAAGVEQFVAALRANAVPVRHLTFSDEGHTVSAEPNRLALVGEVERFLADHLGGRIE